MIVSILSGFSHSFWGNHPSLQVGSLKSGILGKNCAARDVLNGKTALLENMTIEQIQSMLDLVQETRKQFIQDGTEEVNRYLSSSSDLADDKLLNKITLTVLEERLIGLAASIEKIALSHKGI